MLLHWNVSPEILELGPIRLRWYGLMFLAGFSLGYHFMVKICRWENKPIDKLDSLLVHLVLGTTIGARLGHCLFYDPVFYLSNPLEILKIWEGGLASHGGGIGVMIALWWFSRKNPEFSLWWLLDRISIFTVMTGAFIRIGNLMNSEILGKPTDGTWGVIFDRVDVLPRHPAMVYESLSYALIFVLAYFGIYLGIYRRKKLETPKGLLFGFVIAMIMLARFIIEFFKEIQSPFEKDLFLNMGQILSFPFILFGIYFVVRALKAAPVLVEDPRPQKNKAKRRKS